MQRPYFSSEVRYKALYVRLRITWGNAFGGAALSFPIYSSRTLTRCLNSLDNALASTLSTPNDRTAFNNGYRCHHERECSHHVSRPIFSSWSVEHSGRAGTFLRSSENGADRTLLDPKSKNTLLAYQNVSSVPGPIHTTLTSQIWIHLERHSDKWTTSKTFTAFASIRPTFRGLSRDVP